MNLTTLPREERLAAIAAVMRSARAMGLSGMSGECGELAVAMRRTLFGGQAEILAGLNTAFLERDHLVGHFAVRIKDEQAGCLNFDERGVPVADEDIASWGMLDPSDPDYQSAAARCSFELTGEAAEAVSMLIFDDEQDVLVNMPGSGLDEKVTILQAALRLLGYDAGAAVSAAGTGAARPPCKGPR